MRCHGILVCGLVALVLLGLVSSEPASAEAKGAPTTVSFLGARLINDDEVLEPATEAETRRLKLLSEAFSARLDSSGRYKVLVPSPVVAGRIAAGQDPGSCNGCEIDYGKQIGGDLVAWITVQKVSNLILNLNLYVGDVKTGKMTFIHSVDIRGNTDESWMRSLNYLLDNYFLPAARPAAPATQ